MNAAIFIKDRTGQEKSVPVENFEFDIDKGLDDVKMKLIELQFGYCEGPGDRPRVKVQEIKKGNKIIQCIYAESEADFFHIAFLGHKINFEKLKK